MKKIIFITRVKDDEDLKKEELEELLKTVNKVKAIKEKYIILNTNKDGKKVKIGETQAILVHDDDPIGPASINSVLRKPALTEIDAFLVISKEVRITVKDIKSLIGKMKKDCKLLVAGYNFKIDNKKLNDELKDYYANEDLIAYKIPWNTCAIWNYELFNEYVEEFDEITARSPYPDVCVSIDGKCYKTDHKGMEDGLAIAKAASVKKGLYFELIKLKQPKTWEVEPDKAQGHREKLARKETVMRDLMALRDYLVEDLLEAEQNAK